jgi:hypothetical protein
MTFPFSIKYSAKLHENYTSDRNKETLEFIEDFITQKTGDDIVIEDNKLTFKSKFFKWGRWNTNILVPIEKGVFTIIGKGDGTILTYEFYMYHLFIAVTIMSIFMATVSQQVWVGIVCFLWLGGMNWLTAIIRHKMMLREIAKKIDNLINTPKEYGQKGSHQHLAS